MFQIKGWHILIAYHSLQIVDNYTMWMHELQNNSYACKLLKSKQEAS